MPDKQRSRPQAAKVVAFSWASRREAANHEEQKQGETETGSAEDQARPSGSGSRESRRAAVLASLHSPESQRSYRHAIDEFVGWYCSEPRLSFNKTVVTRYRIHLEDRRLAPGTTNVRLAAVRRLADEAADAGLLSPELAAGIRHALWVVQQLREAWSYKQPHRFLLFDRDTKFGADVVSAVRNMGSEPTRTAFRSPCWQNGVAKR